MKTQLAIVCLCALTAAVLSRTATAQDRERSTDGPTYTAGGELIRPADYREWAFVTSGVGMTYGPAQPATGQPAFFDNVFVNRQSYRAFMDTGRWPDKTMFLLEIRRGEVNVSINNGGQTQGEIVALESAVKDSARFPETGWGYFNFGRGGSLSASAAPLPVTASCYNCHGANTAVENTFVQFYPTLFEVAKKMGTVKPTYDPLKKVGGGQSAVGSSRQ
jgi:Cytochrome P460